MKRTGQAGLLTTMTALACLVAGAAPVRAARVKDITRIDGVRSNQLYGVGLVVGLAGTGGGSDFTAEMARNMLKRMNVGRGLSDLDADNLSAVIVTADLPAFARKGSRIDITVSALDEAKSLRGGTLLLTPLVGADGEAYAVAQGAIAVGGYSFGGEATTVSQGHATVGRIARGATVEKDLCTTFVKDGVVTFCLFEPDFATANRIVKAIEKETRAACTVVDAGTVRVRLDPRMMPNEIVAEIDRIEALSVAPDSRAIVVINEKTGTVVAGHNVGIDTIAVSHGNLTVITEERPEQAPPAPFSAVEPAVLPRTNVTIIEEKPVTPGGLTVVRQGTTVNEVARALNALGAGPRDIISIFEAIKAAGALHAELRIM